LNQERLKTTEPQSQPRHTAGPVPGSRKITDRVGVLAVLVALTTLAMTGTGQSRVRAADASDAVKEGDRLLKAGYPVLAIRQYREALRAGATRIPVLIRIAHANCANGDYTSADGVLEDVFASENPPAEAVRLRARIRFWQGRHVSAWPWFRKYLQASPRDAEVRMEYAVSLAWGRRFDDALIEIGKLEKTERFQLEARYRRAEVLAWKKDYERARAFATGLLIRRQASPSLKSRCYVLIGKTLAWEKAYGKAEEEYRKALDVEPRNEHAWLALGEVQEWQGKLEKARASYAKALQVAPTNRRARAALNRLTSK